MVADITRHLIFPIIDHVVIAGEVEVDLIDELGHISLVAGKGILVDPDHFLPAFEVDRGIEEDAERQVAIGNRTDREVILAGAHCGIEAPAAGFDIGQELVVGCVRRQVGR